MTMPNTSTRICKAFEELQEVGTFGNTRYYSCHLPNLSAYALSFVAARRTVNGFRQTDTAKKKYGDAECLPSMGVCISSWDRALDGIGAHWLLLDAAPTEGTVLFKNAQLLEAMVGH